jgi:hypothetical protein
MRAAHLFGSGAVAIVAFVVFAWLTTQVDVLRERLPFTDDPWDAVTSFALIGIAVVGAATIVRALGEFARRRDPRAARPIGLGISIGVVIAAVTLASDTVAVLVVPPPGDLSVATMLALLAGPVVAAVVALVAVWDARSAVRLPATALEPEPDLLDEIEALVETIGAAGLARWLATWLDVSPVSPRRHRILVGVVGGLIAGVGASAWHAFREGAWASPGAAVVFGGLIAIGVSGVYLLGLEPLRLLRSPGVTTRTN